MSAAPSSADPKPYTLKGLADALETGGSLVLKFRTVKEKPTSGGDAGAASGSGAGATEKSEPVIYINIAGHMGPIYFSLGNPCPPAGTEYQPPFLGAVPSKHKDAISDDSVSAFICIPDPEDIAQLRRILTWVREKVIALNLSTKPAFMKKKTGKDVTDLDDYDLWKDFIGLPVAGEDKKNNATMGVKWAVGPAVRDSLRTDLRTFVPSKSGPGIVISNTSKMFNPAEWSKGTRLYSILNISSITKVTNWGITVYARKVLTEAGAVKSTNVAWAFGDDVPVSIEPTHSGEKNEHGEGGGEGGDYGGDEGVDGDGADACVYGEGSTRAGAGRAGGGTACAAPPSFDPDASSVHAAEAAREAARAAARLDQETQQWLKTSGDAITSLGLDGGPSEDTGRVVTLTTEDGGDAESASSAAEFAAVAALDAGPSATPAKPAAAKERKRKEVPAA